MNHLTTEAVTHLSYDSEPPTIFELTDDLFDPRAARDGAICIRKGSETYRITRINIFEATGEVEIECEEAY